MLIDCISALGHSATSRLAGGNSVLPRWSQPIDATLYLKGEMECMVKGQRFHRGFTAAEKTELWDRWKRGESLKAIGRAFGKQSSSIYFLVAPHGGIRLFQRRRSERRLRPVATPGYWAAACTQGKRTQHGKPQGEVSDDQPNAREGQVGRHGVAERFVVRGWKVSSRRVCQALAVSLGEVPAVEMASSNKRRWRAPGPWEESPARSA
jgi:hypothetical protein